MPVDPAACLCRPSATARYRDANGRLQPNSGCSIETACRAIVDRYGYRRTSALWFNCQRACFSNTMIAARQHGSPQPPQPLQRPSGDPVALAVAGEPPETFIHEEDTTVTYHGDGGALSADVVHITADAEVP